MAGKKNINYTSRDFSSIKNDLVQYAKKYYPNTYKDFGEASFGSLMLDTVAYVGDILSFYVDYGVNESFLTTAIERQNIIKIAKQLGFKMPGRASSYGRVQLYVAVPANTLGLGPDSRYIPILQKGSTFGSSNGQRFTLLENVDFSNEYNEIVVVSVDNSTGLPTYYGIKSSGLVVSGEENINTLTVGQFERFRKVRIGNGNITEIIDVFDGEGHEYNEVEYLSQDVIYKEVKNTGENSDTVSSLLKPVPVPRRFVVERDDSGTYLQFGYGSESQINNNKFAEPSDLVMSIHAKNYVSDTSFDPTNLIKTDKFGVGPENTTLTVRYRVNNIFNSNTPTNTVTNVVNSNFRFNDTLSLIPTIRQQVINSIECNNEEPIIGDVSLVDTEELKMRIMNSYATQNRAVTKQDYISLIYSMPTKFGAIKRCNIIQDLDSQKRNLNLYVISENSDGTLVQTNSTIKQNLKLFLNNNKMLNDTIDILDGKIVNIGINFIVLVDLDKDKNVILSNCLATLRTKYLQKFDFGEPFFISDIYTTLNKLEGVSDVVDVQVYTKTGTNYSTTNFDVTKNSSTDGRYIKVPENVILEIKLPSTDIRGSAR